VEEALLLMAVHRIVRCIEIENEAAGSGCVGLNEQVDEQPLHCLAVHGEFAVAVFGILRRMLQPVERRLASKHGAVGTARFELARHQPEHRIMAQFVVVVQILVTQRDAMHTLGQQCLQAVLHPIRSAAIREAGRNLPGQADGVVGPAQQQGACVGRDCPAVERGCDFTASKGFKLELARVTVCWHRLRLQNQIKSLLQNNFL